MSRATSTLEALQAIYADNGNVITPAAVVKASRPVDAPLHSRFEWDDEIAGDRYREVQAAQLIRFAFVSVTTENRGPVRVRAFLAPHEPVPEDDDKPSYSYTAIGDLTDQGSHAVLVQMERDVAALRRKYRDHRDALDALLAATVSAVAS